MSLMVVADKTITNAEKVAETFDKAEKTDKEAGDSEKGIGSDSEDDDGAGGGGGGGGPSRAL